MKKKKNTINESPLRRRMKANSHINVPISASKLLSMKKNQQRKRFATEKTI